MVLKLNKYDRSILYGLSEDSRQSDQKIAKKIKKSKQFVNYRIKRLVEEKVIRSFQCRVNYQLLEVNILFRVFFKLKNLTEESYNNLITYLDKEELIPLYSTYYGVYDLSIIIVEKNLQKAKKILDDFVNKFSENISNYDVFFRYKDRAYPRKCLSENREFRGYPIIGDEETKKVNIDNMDITLLK
ncbi:MAG: Lrp/AsnC family transcriptional regulator, partial [Nanoarchaeota archaeon]